MDITTLSGSQFPKIVIPLIEEAKSSIDIIVFDWRWYENDSGAICQLFNQAILRASSRGLKIRAMVNCDDVIKILRSAGIDAKKLITSKLVHCKLMIIDETIVITGSHNYTQSAFQTNLELSVILKNCAIQNSFQEFYNHLWLK